MRQEAAGGEGMGRLWAVALSAALVAALAAGCGQARSNPFDSGPGGRDADVDGGAKDADRPGEDADQGPADGSADADGRPPLDGGAGCEGMAEGCVSEFGSLFTRSNGRADGTLVALVGPTDTGCPTFNDDHVVLEVSMAGGVQRLVVSVGGVAVHAVRAPLLGPPFSEGWHRDLALDYPTDLGAHSGEFTPVTMDEAVAFTCSELEVGAPIAVFAYSDGSNPSSAHQIHRNDRYPDGAIVARPTSDEPVYLLYRYLDQTF